MNNSLIVCVCERFRDVSHDADRIGDRECTALEHAIPQRMSIDERHREVRQSVDLAGCVHGNDVRMLKSRGESDLTLESFDAQAFGHLRWQNLDDNLSAEGGLGCNEYARHPTASQLAVDVVRGAEGGLKLIAKRVRHVT